MDYLTLEPSRGHGNILVITDHFTKYALAIPTKNQTAKTTADAFYNHFIVNYGIPTKLHTDQGANFESDLIKELCHITGMRKTRTTPYHAMGNGCTERWNRTLLDMLGTLEPSKKPDWKNYIPSLVYAYNCTKHESTKTTPFELMFGRKPKLPIDAVFETSDIEQPTSKTTKDYIQNLKKRMQTTQEIAKKYTDKARAKQKKQYDKKATASRISVGDKVLIKILAFDGKHKIADKFEEEVYEVVEQPRLEIPVFRLRSKSGIEKVLHRNHLLPIQTTDSESEEEIKIMRPVPKPRKLKKQKDEIVEKSEPKVTLPEINRIERSDVTSDSESSDSGDEYVPNTYKSGDAHIPEITDKVNKVDRKKDSRTEELEREMHVKEVDETRKHTGDEIHGSQIDNMGIHTEDDDMRIHTGEDDMRIHTEEKNMRIHTGDDNLGTHTEDNMGIHTEYENLRIHTEDPVDIGTDSEVTNKDSSVSEVTDKNSSVSGVTDKDRQKGHSEIEMINEAENRKGEINSTETVLERERGIREGAIRKVPNIQKRVMISEEPKIETIETRESNIERKRKGQKPLPKIPTRRSEREKRLPANLKDYEMNVMVSYPPDYRLHALDVFINSGVLKDVDPEVAKKVINAVMQ
ncbi:uncharacterized protein LOC128546734 [Mercenaria mercenaria]|uniref:uncharacterized protein LOC128546734 n=1 Tax=Mercenaria mercenaria TaxID=6596 RepID=UPI00234FA9B3|nr:uncharacterized protein LOC128546734 [Mercenaria mercenaria]